MRVHLQYKLNTSGKGKFLTRLIPALEDLGVKVQWEAKKADVTLGLMRWREGIPKGPRILRIDGVHLLDTKDRRWKNKVMKKSIQKTHTIIWQSLFAKRIGRGVLGVNPEREYVIFNGANPRDYDDVIPAETPYKHNVLMCGKWSLSNGHMRDHKRLPEMIKIVQQYQREDVGFWIAGRHTIKPPKAPNIHMLGHLDESELRRYLKMADVLLNLSLYDFCPNAVVETLVSGTPVICTAGDGVEEITGTNGIVLDFGEFVPAKYVPKYNGITISEENEQRVHAALDSALDNPIKVDCKHLHITESAKAYKRAFEETINAHK